MMLEEYCFRCECLACLNNYPTFKQLKINDKKIHKLAKKMKSDMLKQATSSQALEKYSEVSKLIENNFHKFPSQEIILLQEILVQCLSTVSKPKFLFP